MSDPGTSSAPLRASKRRRISRTKDQTPSRSTSTATTTTDTPGTSCSPAPPTTTVKSAQPAPLRRFLNWCTTQGVTISPSADLRYSGNDQSWSISCHANQPIPTDTVLATIPKSAVLSRKTSALSPVIKGKWLSESHETVGLELALCLLYERLLGSKSKFEPFLSILPRLPVPLPFLRDSEPSGSSPWRWIAGTEAQRIDERASYSYHASNTGCWSYDHDYGMSKQKAIAYYHTVGIPVLSRSKLFSPTQKQHLDALESAFLTAYTHVSSRDFIVDTFHGVGLVPVADLFNHSEAHTVQFESDQDVCKLCGVAFITGHEEEECRFGMTEEERGSLDVEEEDDDEGLETQSDDDDEVEKQDDATQEDEAQELQDEEEGEEELEEEAIDEDGGYQDTLDMRTLTNHSAGEEIYNTYGQLPNSLLLTRYGFCLDTETEMERYTLDLRFPSERATFFHSFVSHPSSAFKDVAAVKAAFDKVLSQVHGHFPPEKCDDEQDEEEEEEQLDPKLKNEKHSIDALYQLETLLPNPSWAASTFAPLFQKSPQIDEDLEDRDQIYPLFLSSTGGTSIVLFLLTYLIHSLHTHSHSKMELSTILNPPALTTRGGRDSVVQATLKTLHRYWEERLQNLYITSRLQQSLVLLEEQSGVEYVEKACIHHGYQEYAALKSALSSLEELLESC